MMIIMGSSTVAKVETEENYGGFAFLLLTAFAIFGASQVFLNFVKAFVNAMYKVKTDENTQNTKVESAAQTTEQFMKLVPTRLLELNAMLKSVAKDHKDRKLAESPHQLP